MATARTLIESHGLQQLSYPRLAKELKAGTSSLYLYYPSKDDLLAALVDEVTREMYLRLAPIGDGPWDKEIIGNHVAYRRLLERTPIYREVFAYRTQTLFLGSRMAPHVLRSIEAGLAMFVRAGLKPDEAAHALNAFSMYTRAFVLVEHGIDEENIDQHSLQMINFLLANTAADLPAVGALDGVESIVSLGDDVFRTGLDLLVAGLCDRHPVLRQSAAKSRRKGTEKDRAR